VSVDHDDAQTEAAPAARETGPGPPADRPTPGFFDRPWVQRAVVWGALLVAWEIFARRVGDFFFPTLGSVVVGLGEVFTDGSMFILATSLRQMFVGYVLAVVIGVPLGLLIGSSRIAEWTFGLYVNALFVTSLTALLPFLILLFGVGLPFRASVVFLFSVFFLIMNPASGVRSIDHGLKEMTRSFGANGWKRFLSLTLPGTAPFILSGMRLGLGQAVQGMIISELWITADTGRRLIALADRRLLGEFFAFTIVIVVVGVLLTQGLMVVQRRLTPWAESEQRRLGG
jgi:ABC-type nitrate/sulfonate/bicarbonate transport system permease component